MFEFWLEQEKATIKSRFEIARVICIVFVILMIPNILMVAGALLDSGGVVLIIPILFSGRMKYQASIAQLAAQLIRNQ